MTLLTAFTTRLNASNLRGKPRIIQMLKDAMADCKRTTDSLERYPDAMVIIDRVCKVSGLTDQELQAPGRQRRSCMARQVCMYLIRQWYGSEVPLVVIGDWFGGRDHSTVLSAIRTVRSLLAAGDRGVVELVRECKQEP